MIGGVGDLSLALRVVFQVIMIPPIQDLTHTGDQRTVGRSPVDAHETLRSSTLPLFRREFGIPVSVGNGAYGNAHGEGRCRAYSARQINLFVNRGQRYRRLLTTSLISYCRQKSSHAISGTCMCSTRAVGAEQLKGVVYLVGAFWWESWVIILFCGDFPSLPTAN